MYAWTNAIKSPNAKIGIGYRNGNATSDTSISNIVALPKVLPKRRMARERGLENSSIRLRGKKTGLGLINLLKYETPLSLIPKKCIAKKVVKAKAIVALISAVGASSTGTWTSNFPKKSSITSVTGNTPNTLHTRIKMKRLAMKDEYFLPFEPITPSEMDVENIYKISQAACMPEICLPFFIMKNFALKAKITIISETIREEIIVSELKTMPPNRQTA
ncbi:MAG: hypothetical protein WC527_04220 [Candidatus Margulisiibacteriota bacterium]